MKEQDNAQNNFMKSIDIFENGGIHQFDGYVGPPIWVAPETGISCFDPVIDSQCEVPSKSLAEIKKELNLESPEKKMIKKANNKTR